MAESQPTPTHEIRQHTSPESGKTCKDCRLYKPLDAFSRGTSKDGRRNYCKVCCSRRHSEYLAAKKDASFDLPSLLQRKDIRDRFWAKVDITDYCWIWNASIGTDGYGAFRIDSRTFGAHRIAYLLKHGSIPDGLFLDHVCRNRACVNPAHLEPVTNRENVLRGVSCMAKNAAKTHCPKGHPYVGRNIILEANGARRCRYCTILKDRARRGHKANTANAIQDLQAWLFSEEG